MQCSICHKSGRPMYCAHCMSSSPHLLLKLKLDLLILRETNGHLKSRVEDILEYGLGQIAGKEPKSASTNVKGDILGRRLRKLDSVILRRKNNRVKYRISQLNRRIYEKRHRIEALRSKLQLPSKIGIHEKELKAKRESQELTISEGKQQLTQIRKVLLKSQLSKIRSLVEWFVIRKRESYEFPYTLAFQPIVSLRNVYKLPSSVVWGSISTMSRYLKLFAEILFFTLPHNELVAPNAPELELEVSAKTADESSSDENTIVDHLTKIFINIIQISRHLNLISKDPIDLAWMLDQNDLDTLFYNMAMRLETKSKPVFHHWTYPQILAVVSEALQLSSVYATSPVSRQTLTGTKANNNDRWYVVR
ncbi:hypothetical protein ZYGR_0I07200 [Zygosaccharomyces rouxii]|uniref:Autophagy-related protein 14 n=1 Tax=Zygosaccharomyces rouxii TaxID=4956 RepID=A0A1Q2ZYP5_ZYGRO|nr:hypothetical protein ZYGR_0I07200 [Zygosaccharomyces rouxii]